MTLDRVSLKIFFTALSEIYLGQHLVPYFRFIGMFQIILYILFSLITSLLCLELWLRSRKAYQLAKFLPGPQLYPIIGAIDFLFLDQEEMYKAKQKAMKKYGTDYGIYLAGKLSYFSANANVVEVSLHFDININKWK